MEYLELAAKALGDIYIYVYGMWTVRTFVGGTNCGEWVATYSKSSCVQCAPATQWSCFHFFFFW